MAISNDQKLATSLECNNSKDKNTLKNTTHESVSWKVYELLKQHESEMIVNSKASKDAVKIIGILST